MPRSKAHLSRDVLLQMNVCAPEESPGAADAATVEDTYDRKLREWRDEGLVFWPNGTNRNTEEIPDQVYGIICDLMENEVRNQFKGDNPPVQRMAQEQVLCRRLHRHMAKPPSGEPTSFSSY